MANPLNMLPLARMRPPVRRVLALDAGSRCVKLLLAESDFGHLRLVRQEKLDLKAEGLLAPEEVKAHLQTTLEAWGRPPLAIVLPQHISISQILDLPAGPEQEVERQIADETVKLSGVSESRIIYDFARTESAVPQRQQFWVTLAQEGEIRERIARLGLEQEDICEVTTTANALVTAYRASSPLSSRTVLVHMGAQTTVVVILLAGQGAFATSFQMGGDFLTRALAGSRGISEDAAERAKAEMNCFSFTAAGSVEFLQAVDGWVNELRRQLDEWFLDKRRQVELEDFELVASGGGLEAQGFLEYLRQRAELKFKPWPGGNLALNKGFETAMGAALQALGYSAQPVSLLPDEYSLAWRKRFNRQRIETFSALVACLCLLALGLGTWQKWSLIQRKQALLNKVSAAQEAVDTNDALSAELVAEYESLRPVLAAHQNTVDTLKAIRLLQQARKNRNMWFVLAADQQSYFSPPAAAVAAPPAGSNVLAAASEATMVYGPSRAAPAITNVAVAHPGFISELCVPGEAEPARQLLSEVVAELKQQPLFSKVDLLSDDLRRHLADPKVVVPDRHYVLALDFAEQDFQSAARWKKATGLNSAPRRGTRPAKAAAEPELTTNSAK